MPELQTSLPILPSAQSQLKKDKKGMKMKMLKMVAWFLDKARFVKEVLEPEANVSGGLQCLKSVL